MSTVHVVAKRDFLESLTVARPLVALAELVWNGFDAQSDRVEVFLDSNGLGGLQTIRIRDAGYGINHAHVTDLFGSLGDSWKKKHVRQGGRPMHGKSGKGRFRAFALGNLVEWNTVFTSEDGATKSYRIRGTAAELDGFEIFDPVEAKGASTGTEVVISNLKAEFGSLLQADAPLELGKLFAAFLTDYPGLVLEYHGTRVDPAAAQTQVRDYALGDVALSDQRKAPVAVRVVEWSMPTDRALHLCDAGGVPLHEAPAGQQIRAPGFNFTAYVKSDYLRELEKQNQLVLDELHPDVLAILKAARNQIREHFRRRLLADEGRIVERWQDEQIYPYAAKADVDPIEAVERQVFDILAVNLETALPSFGEADAKSRKFAFRLLAQAVRENPDSAQAVMAEVLGLKKEAQEELAELLRGTPLSSLLRSAKVVADRLNVLNTLAHPWAGQDGKPARLKRAQLRGLLEKEAWLFGEEFGLAGSELRLEEVLAKLPERKAVGADLRLHKVVQPRAGEYEYLIVELKAPSTQNDEEVLARVKALVRAVTTDERFQGVAARWTFLALTTEPASATTGEANPPGRPGGKMYHDAELNLTVWIKTWTEVINDARARLGLVNQQLADEAKGGRAQSLLSQAHAKFIPQPEAKAESAAAASV